MPVTERCDACNERVRHGTTIGGVDVTYNAKQGGGASDVVAVLPDGDLTLLARVDAVFYDRSAGAELHRVHVCR